MPLNPSSPAADWRAAIRQTYQQTRPESLQPAARIYDRFQEHVDFLREIGRDDGDFRQAAVLLPLVEQPDGLTVLLTKRAAHLNQHGGQIAFPGGSVDADDHDTAATALRETEEEVGIPPAAIQIVGFMKPLETFTGFSIHPVVGFVEPGLPLRLDPAEVDSAFEVPLAFLADPDNRQTGFRDWRRQRFEYSYFDYDGQHIWGATAAILLRFLDSLGVAGATT